MSFVSKSNRNDIDFHFIPKIPSIYVVYLLYFILQNYFTGSLLFRNTFFNGQVNQSHLRSLFLHQNLFFDVSFPFWHSCDYIFYLFNIYALLMELFYSLQISCKIYKNLIKSLNLRLVLSIIYCQIYSFIYRDIGHFD
jgi:hypothetical protein